MTLPLHLGEWDEEAAYTYAERVAIIHIEGRVPLSQAEDQAEKLIRAWDRAGRPPPWGERTVGR